jgi:hypothetical protein
VLRQIVRWLRLPRKREVATWWLVAMPEEQYLVHATEWHIGRFRSVYPMAVYVYHEMAGPDRDGPAQALEEMREQDFASMIIDGTAHRIA